MQALVAKEQLHDMSKSALIIFVKNPELGDVKTRLAATIGDQAALEIYRKLLTHTASIIEQLSVDRFVFYSQRVEQKDCFADRFFVKRVQQGESLGERMEQAFRKLFQKNYENVVIIGSDCYDLSPSDLNTAFESLESNDVVIGPALDGGYYLLGMNRLYSELFRDKQWSTEEVLPRTIQDTKDLGLSCFKMRALSDIDHYEDLNRELKQVVDLK